jgi:hypothetical protein
VLYEKVLAKMRFLLCWRGGASSDDVEGCFPAALQEGDGDLLNCKCSCNFNIMEF